MFQIDRRSFVRALTFTGLVSSAEASSLVASAKADSKSVDGPLQGDTQPAKDVTRSLARYVVSARTEDLPENVRKEATRTMLNWVGCTVGGSGHETVDNAMGALAPFSGPAQASVLGRSERMDVLHAALMNGIS